MPYGEWREIITHPDGSNGNSGLDRDNPILDIGIGYTNLRFVMDAYHGRLTIGAGMYLTENWPIIKHDHSLHIRGWGYVNYGDPGEYYGIVITRPDTVASDGKPFMRPLTLAEQTTDREIREHNLTVRDMGFDGNMDASPVNLTTPAPIIQISHGGNGCLFERFYARMHRDAVIQAMHDGVYCLLRHVDHGGGAAFEALQDPDPFTGTLNDPCLVAIHGQQNDNSGTDTPLWIVRLVGKSTSKSKVFIFNGMTTEQQHQVVQHQPGPSASDKGWKVLHTGIGGYMGSPPPDRTPLTELAGTGEGAFWHVRGNATGGGGTEEFYDSAKEGLTYGSGAGEQPRELLEFMMAPGWTAPKAEVM